MKEEVGAAQARINNNSGCWQPSLGCGYIWKLEFTEFSDV